MSQHRVAPPLDGWSGDLSVLEEDQLLYLSTCLRRTARAHMDLVSRDRIGVDNPRILMECLARIGLCRREIERRAATREARP